MTKKIQAFILMMLLVQMAWASHIVGGGFSYRYLGNNQYKIQLDYFKDCGPSAIGFPPGALKVGCFENGTNQLKEVFQFTIDSTITLDFSQAACVSSPVNCVQKRTYSVVATLMPDNYNHPEGYYFVYEQCCRNALAQNIANPQDIGSAYYLAIPPLTLKDQLFENSSPVFQNYPALLLCAFENYDLDFSAKETDGDSLVYSLVEPLKGHANANNLTNQTGQVDPLPGPYESIVWNSGYGLSTNILDGNPDLKIDPKTGLLTVLPTKIGVYLAAIKCDEYRNGIKISEIRREMQFAIVQCPNRFEPVIECQKNCKSQQLIPDSLMCFDFFVTDSNQLDSIKMNLQFVNKNLISDYTFDATPGLSPQLAKLCFKSNCALKKGDTLIVQLLAKDNACPYPLKSRYEFKLPFFSMNDDDLIKSLPNVFTPNEDGVNDFYFIPSALKQSCAEKFRVKIYNRWGKMVYESQSIQFKWDGSDLPVGLYFVYFDVNGQNLTTNITLLR
jgi:gliding motility-associated-like protein